MGEDLKRDYGNSNYNYDDANYDDADYDDSDCDDADYDEYIYDRKNKEQSTGIRERNPAGSGPVIKADGEDRRQVMEILTRSLPPRSGIYADFPKDLDTELINYLREKGIDRLYCHQAEMFEKAGQGADLVITTSTASGKTLSFLLPVLNEILRDPAARALFVYPTKALAADQQRVIEEALQFFGDDRIAAGVYDGDTLPAERTRIRKTANIILTNPEMLNSAFLPNHSRYGFDGIFSHLKFVVVDELHSYKGAFGAHMANIFRRMKRVCDYYHSHPQFLCSSATIANPQELAAAICGRDFLLIDKDGSPSGEKVYHILQPPVIRGNDDQIYGRVPASQAAADLIPELVEEERHFIAFARSRRNVEVILKEARDKLDAAGFLGPGSKAIAGYRGGYTPVERHSIEKRMINGDLLGLVSTNALELGIDIGDLDTTVLVGYPGTRASFWQQTGRSGRKKNRAQNYLLLENEPFDQYIAIDPDWLFGQESEHAIVDPDNLLIELAHVRAAAAEMPLTMDDLSLFPDLGEILPVLMKAAEVRSLSGRFAWAGPAFPAGDYSLRNMDKSRYKMICDGRTVTEMDETQAFHELYPGAVYLHEGSLYEILKLDLVSRTAEGHPFTGNYYTVPAGEKDTRILHELREKELGLTKIHYGDINISDIVMMFKKLQFHNHQNLGYVDLTLPLAKDYDTESSWIRIPDHVAEVFRTQLVYDDSGKALRGNYFEGMAHALLTAAMMVTMTAGEDIGSVVSNNALIPNPDPEEEIFLYIYDRYEGGLGYAEKIHELMPEIVDRAAKLVRGCSCKDGCPACVGDYTLDKKLVLWGIENFLEETEAPVVTKLVHQPNRPSVQRHFSFFRLHSDGNDSQWREFCDEVRKNGEAGNGYLSSIARAVIEDHRLILFCQTRFLADWLAERENLRSLENILRSHAVCPADMKLVVKTAQSDPQTREDDLWKKERLRRKYETIHK